MCARICLISIQILIRNKWNWVCGSLGQNAKPMSRRMRSRCRYSSAEMMSKRIPDNAKSMSRRMRSRYQDISKSSQIPAAGKGFQSSEIGPPWSKTAPNRLPGAFGETDHIQTRGLVDSFWRSCWHFVMTLYTVSVQFPDAA